VDEAATASPEAAIGTPDASAEAAEATRTEGYDLPADEPEEPEPDAFAATGLSPEILRAISEKGYTTPTPIQAQAIPYVLMGRDLMGVAQTGTGKTASFTLPMLDILSGSRARARMPRSLILEPTRELALQVAENFVDYGKYLKLTHALIIGGESMADQKEALMRGVDVLIATPGRLIDIFERGGLLLTDCRVLVIDEADRMLDMGFVPDVERIVAMLPANRQTLFFSATMAPEIRRLSDAFLQNPKVVTVSKAASVAPTITARMALVAETDKREALRRLVRSEDVQNALIFCNRKRDVDILFKSLQRHGFSVGALHGDMVQSVRFATLEKFKAGQIRLLCCSDVAARGLDIGGLSHVFNFDVPIHAEDYVHRIGRTGRAGREGRTFMLATSEDRQTVEAIEKLTGAVIERITIEGLDEVAWSEGGRRGRGRGAGPDKTSAKAPPRTPAAAPIPVARAPEVPNGPKRRLPRATASGPAPVVTETASSPASGPAHGPALDPATAPQPGFPPLPTPRPLREPRQERERGRDRRPEQNRGEQNRGEPKRAPEPVARERQPERARNEDAGERVVGFGSDVPAFMMVAARRRPEPAEIEPAPLEVVSIKDISIQDIVPDLATADLIDESGQGESALPE